MQATVSPAPDAEPRPGTGHNTGVSGTTHAIAHETSHGAPGPAATSPPPGRRPRPIRYGHSASGPVAPAAPPTAARNSSIAPPTGELPPTAGPASGIEPPTGEPSAAEREFESSAVPADGLPFAGTVITGSVVPDTDPEDADPMDGYPVDGDPGDYDDTAGLVYEAPRAAYRAPADPSQQPPHNEGLGIFGGVATTEVPDEDDAPARQPQHEPAQPLPGPVSTVGIAWNQTSASPAVASDEAEDRKPNPFDRIRGIRLGGQPQEPGDPPRPSVRELPPDVQMSFIRDRVIIVLVVGVLSFVFVRNWPLTITLMIIAFVLDMVRRQRTAALYVNGGAHPGARRSTTRQLRKMRRDGYFTLDARPIPGSPEVIDHLVIGPTGVYAIDSEKWNPKLPIRTWNGKKLYHGPESQKDRLDHAVWEASQASEILSGALGFDVAVRPALAIYGPKIPWDIATIRNVDVFTGSALAKYLKARKRMRADVSRLTREEVRTIYDAAARVLPDVADAYAPVS